MRKMIAVIIAIFIIVSIILIPKVNATTEEVIDTKTESKIIEIKESSQKSLEEYKERYGSETYGFTAYILNLVRIYSIPFCFLGITVSGIYQYIIGIRKLDIKEKGLVLMVSFITLLVICQVLPLVFAIVVKGRG